MTSMYLNQPQIALIMLALARLQVQDERKDILSEGEKQDMQLLKRKLDDAFYEARIKQVQ